jgi:NAD(P)-dependent dehydrogenase (short-subunit alcohol dehydrogenase family)
VVIAEQAADRILAVSAAVADLGVKALGLTIDVSRSEDVQRMVQETVRHFGKIDILVNDAGRVLVKPMVQRSEAGWDRVVDTNLKGVFLCCRYVVPEMIARQSNEHSR